MRSRTSRKHRETALEILSRRKPPGHVTLLATASEPSRNETFAHVLSLHSFCVHVFAIFFSCFLHYAPSFVPLQGHFSAWSSLLQRDSRKAPTDELGSFDLIQESDGVIFCNESYRALGADGYWLTREAMQWFWDSYVPAPERHEFTVSPLRASLAQLRGLPPALILTCENDVVRDEGEAYAHKLMAAGVPVRATRYLGAIHDLALLNPITGTLPARAALAQVIDTLRTVFAHKAP